MQGAVPLTSTLSGKLANGTMVPLQLDVKARHADGSARHAVISAVLPSLTAGQPQVMSLVTAAPYAASTGATPAALLSSGFTAAAHLTLAGKAYSVSAETLLKDGKFTNWLAGPIVNEWHVTAPMKAADGTSHPHLTARIAIRSYTGSKKTRVDFTIENNWAHEPEPQNFLYDARLVVGGQTVYTKDALNHFHHARWRKLAWWGGEPQVDVKHNGAYMMQTRAVPNYDQTIVYPESAFTAYMTTYTGTRTEPMGVGLALFGMGAAGGRQDIGILPGWTVTYLMSQDKRAKYVTMGTADLAGSWPIHYRNKATDRPVSLIDFPYLTILGGSAGTLNKATGKLEAFPSCPKSLCTVKNTPDTSHQPSFAYVPYIVSGDYYYLEELQFWAMYSTFVSNPSYREHGKGLVKSDQVRGQAWTLRTLAQAAWISPDTDPLKAHFEYFMGTNLDWFNENYTNGNGAFANTLGVITNGYAVTYKSGLGIGPWMDDFFTSAIGYASEMGFTKATPLLAYKSKFPVDRMTAAGSCWQDGAAYSMQIRDTTTGPFYSTFAQVYKATHTPEVNAMVCNSPAMATALKVKVGEMPGYSGVTTGYPSNMQPALAYAANVPGLEGKTAWAKFMARTVKPNYSKGPQFAIVPR
ncbi:hypothetical protein I4X03_002275 [Massilia sp. R798]|uniref:Uncharacterized protein n=1 Tax=Massilia soli TaxID=2792854 RepID=A0ABS7SIP5_9BURK|nr:hypothetical protein [Massilia soli]